MTESAQPTPLLAARAALALVRAGQQETVVRSLQARGAGESWQELATALGLQRDGGPDLSAAYLLVLGARADDPWWSPATGVLWTCSACEEPVRDFGPTAGGPDEREAGHAPDCVRHNAEVAAWDEQWT